MRPKIERWLEEKNIYVNYEKKKQEEDILEEKTSQRIAELRAKGFFNAEKANLPMVAEWLKSDKERPMPSELTEEGERQKIIIEYLRDIITTLEKTQYESGAVTIGNNQDNLEGLKLILGINQQPYETKEENFTGEQVVINKFATNTDNLVLHTISNKKGLKLAEFEILGDNDLKKEKKKIEAQEKIQGDEQ